MDTNEILKLTGISILGFLLLMLLLMIGLLYVYNKGRKKYGEKQIYARAITKSHHEDGPKVTFSTFENENISLIVDDKTYLNINEGEEYSVSYIDECALDVRKRLT